MKRNAEISNEDFSIKFLGAASGMVTGSLYRLDVGESNIVIDAGIFQGKNDAVLPNGKSRNKSDIGAIKGVKNILLTHAHADHVGRLPLFYKKDAHPMTLATTMTRKLAEVILYDSAKIQKEQDKLYDSDDVARVMNFVKEVQFGKKYKIGNGHDRLSATWIYNGHIPGSASILIEQDGKRGGILFSGDIGKEINAICGGWGELPEARPEQVPIKTLIVESTNFDKEPVNFDEKYETFLDSINEILGRGGSVVLPALSMQRSQEITEMIHHAQIGELIPRDCAIIKDAPLAGKFEAVYIENADIFMTRRFGNDENYYNNLGSSKKRFDLNNCQVIANNKESQRMSDSLAYGKKASIVLTGGGMCGFGRVRNYIDRDFGKNPKNGVVLTCYQVEGTEGEEITKQERLISRDGELGATVRHLDIFSGHISGESDLFKYLDRFNLSELELINIVHGSNDNRNKMAEAIKKRGYPGRIVLPEIWEEVNFSL